MTTKQNKKVLGPEELFNSDDDWEVSKEYAAELASKFELEDLPLFASDTPADITGKPSYEALQSLIYDNETPDSLALHFKEKGNEYFNDGKKHYNDAIISYTNGINQKDIQNMKLKSQLYSNRAHIHFIKGSFVECIDDCKNSLNYDNTNLKAFQKAIKASLKLELYQQAFDFSLEAIKLHQDNNIFKELHMLCEKKLNESKQKKIQNELLHLQKTKQALEKQDKFKKSLEAIGINLSDPLYELPPHINTSYIDQDMKYHWTIILLLDELMIQEFICDMDETSTLKAYMKRMFPSQNDSQNQSYDGIQWDNIYLYYEPRPSEFYYVSQKKTLKTVIREIKIVSYVMAFHIFKVNSDLHLRFLDDNNVIHSPLLS